MKKIISLALAASMVAGMSVASFARTTDIFEEPYVNNESGIYTYTEYGDHSVLEEATGEIDVKGGKPVAIEVKNPLSNSEMKRYKAYFEASVGADMVKSVELKYHKYVKDVQDGSDGAAEYELKSGHELAFSGIYDLGTVSYSKEMIDALIANNTITLATGERASDYSVRLYVNTNGAKTTNFTMGNIAYVASANLADRAFAPVVVNSKKDKLSFERYDFTAVLNASQKNILEHNMKEIVKNATKKSYPNATDDKFDSDYAWFVVINFNNEAANIDEDVMGKVTVAKSSAVAKDNFENEECYKELNFLNINKVTKPHEHDEYATNQELEDFEFELDGQQAMLVVDTTGVKDAFYTCFTTKMNETVWDKYSEPDYELYFYGFDNAVKFNRTGDLFFYAEDAEFTADWHVYEIVDAKTGELKEVPAVYDEEENTLKIRTRVLKNYVVSEEDLLATEDAPVEEDKTDAPVEEVKPEKDVPNTGR